MVGRALLFVPLWAMESRFVGLGRSLVEKCGFDLWLRFV